MATDRPEEKTAVRGLENVAAGQTRVSYVDGVNGVLVYSGYDVHDLAEKATFDETVHLIWYGKLPNETELKNFRARLVGEMRLPSQVIDMIALAPRGAHPMDMLRTAISALSMFDPDSGDLSPEAKERKMIRLLAQVMTIIADMHRVRNDQSVLSPDPKLDIGDNFLYMFTGKTPTREEAAAFDHLLLLHLDHGFNASTFSARVTASTLTDMHAALTSALGTLKGSLHGGANEKVLNMLHEIDDVEMVDSYIEGMLNDGQRIMGFGHRVYKVEDPRARLLREWSEKLCHRADMAEYYNISHRIETVVMKKKGIYPNVDFYSATVQHALGIPGHYFTAIFAASRTAGWLAHVMEQHADNRLIRPTSNYIGGWNRKVQPIEERE